MTDGYFRTIGRPPRGLRGTCLLFAAFFLIFASSCRRETEEALLIDDEIFESSENAGASAGTQDTDPRAEEADQAPSGLMDSEIYNLLQPNRIFGHEENIYFLSGSWRSWFMVSADRISGDTKPLCTKPDCPHNQSSCGAYVPFYGELSAISASDDCLYYAGTVNNGCSIFKRELPDGPAEKLADVSLEDLFPVETNATMFYNTGCFYQGDFYYPVCAGAVPNDGTDRDGEFYATVLRTPVTSGRPQRRIVSDKITGFDSYTVGLMPREEGLYIIELMSKEDRLEDGIHPLKSRMDIYLYNPSGETTEPVFSTEFEEGLYIRNCCIRGGKVYVTAFDREQDTMQVFLQEMTENEPKVLLSAEQHVNEVYRDILFTKDKICFYGTSASGESMNRGIELYDYEGRAAGEFTLDIPDVLKPENPEEFIINGSINRMTEILGSDDDCLYFHDSYWSESNESADFYFAVSADGLRLTPFVAR